MKFITPLQAVNKAYLKLPVTLADIDRFKQNYASMRLAEREGETEEYYKNLVTSLLTQTWYGTDYPINTYGRCDAVIYNGNTNDSKPAVIIEMKSPTNRSEMITVDNPNKKALHEILLYFLREYHTNNNHELKYLIICNFNEWFVFNAKDFADYIDTNKDLIREYDSFTKGQYTDEKTSTFYIDIASKHIDALLKGNIEVVYLNHDYILSASQSGNENKLVALYKLLSPETLLNKPFANDSNSLDKNFYAELLHIIGLEEVREGQKKVIKRKAENKRDNASLLEATITRLSMDMDNEDEKYDISLRLVITWINRLLFLKLLEAQQLAYNNNQPEYRILTTDFILTFDDLNDLFFHGLAKRPSDRAEKFKKKYHLVPYLNSSLFEKSEEERKFFDISAIQSEPMKLFKKTVLKDQRGRRLTDQLKTLDYLFFFLDAYNFSSDGDSSIQANSKTLINASVLGLIFEKINGYKEGSFFTPGFITQYMAHETIHKAIVTKFKEVKCWDCKSLQDIRNQNYDGYEANAIINSLRICDPAVGSGHFLVSCLNELVSIKSQLWCLYAPDGTLIKPSVWELRVENDELVVYDADGNLYRYNKNNIESRRVQEALFNAKREIIENCLFGVDINPNSVNICMLRLWIELLKHTYYTAESNYTDLETLPNIDINIKCGNSLISKYSIEVGNSIYKDESIYPSIRKEIREYREKVRQYKRTCLRSDKQKIRDSIIEIKNRITEPVQLELFEKNICESSGIYKNSLEWMVEFPEVLDDNAKFLGFDVVIGNPPYALTEHIGISDNLLSKYQEYKTNEYKSQLYSLFFERSVDLSKKHGVINLLTPNTYCMDKYKTLLREFLVKNTNILTRTEFGRFDTADIVVSSLFTTKKQPEPTNKINTYRYAKDSRINSGISLLSTINQQEWMSEENNFQFVDNAKISLKNFNLLGNLCHVYLGIQIISREQSLDKDIHNNWYKIIHGGNIQRYHTENDFEYFNFRKEFIKSGGDINVYKQKTVIVPQCRNHLVASLRDEDVLASNTAFSIYPKSDNRYTPFLLLALLNSTFLCYYWDNILSEHKDLFPKINKHQLIQLPIPVLDSKSILCDKIEKISEEIFKQKQNNIKANIDSLEYEINQHIYQLYELTDEEIAIVEGNND